VGSRAEGRATVWSDWDFRVGTTDFVTVSDALPDLFGPLAPLAQQWDRFGSHRCWMLVVPGPAKVELLFPDQPQTPEPPWIPSAGNLEAIDRQFWDWVLWATGKENAGRREVIDLELRMLFDHLLAPLGIEQLPASIAEARDAYRNARDRMETRFGVHVPRTLDIAVTGAAAL
jgi:hypothetical protein